MAVLSSLAVPVPGRRRPMARAPRYSNDPTGQQALYDDYRGRYPDATDEDLLTNAYTDFLGRDPDEEGLAGHRANPSPSSALGAIYFSPEGADYRRSQRRPLSSLVAPAAETPVAPAGRRGWTGTAGIGLGLDAPVYGNSGAEWAGFNNDRALSGGDSESTKDAFFRWTYGLDFNPAGKSKEEIEAYLRGQVSKAREYGLNILDVKGEQILIETKERGPEWVDVVEKAGGPGSRWQWLTQAEFGVASPGQAAAQTTAAREMTRDGRWDTQAFGPLPQAEFDAEGNAVIRVTPEAYRRLAGQQRMSAPSAVPRRRVLSDLALPQQEMV